MAQETAIFRVRDGEREEVRRAATLPRRSFVLLKARDGQEWQSGWTQGGDGSEDRQSNARGRRIELEGFGGTHLSRTCVRAR